MKKQAKKDFRFSPALRATSFLRQALPFLGGLVFFLTVCLCGPSTIKGTALWLFFPLAVAFVCLFIYRDRLSAPLLCLALLCTMGGVSTLYALAGKFALSEFLKLFTSLSLVLILLGFCRGKTPGRTIAQVLATFSALAGLVSIDLISTRFLSGVFTGFLGLFSGDYTDLAGVEAGVRMISLFDNPNFFAGLVGLGVLLSLSLVLSEATGWRRTVHICLLYVNALAFLLAFSMGASGAIALAFLVYLALELPQRRSAALVLMVETLLLTAGAAALVSLGSLGVWTGPRPVPLLCAVLGSAALWALDRYVGQRLAGKLKGKAVVTVIAVILALLVVFALVAYHWTAGVSLGQGETLRRAIYPQPGEYTLVTGPDGQAPQVQVTVESQNQQEAMMHTFTVLYQGPLDQAAFAVPGDSLVVYLDFTAQGEARLDSVLCQGAESYKIPLRYPLLPGFIANRLQGLRANQNAIQRLVFFADGMKMFRRSPVVGLGMGAYENAIRSVQSFDYETKYAHNHYIQCLVETGVIGLALFVGLLAVSAVCVVVSRRKKGEDGATACHPLTPALGAAVVFMAVHAATEVVFSTYPYLPMAFGVFALVGLCCGDAISLKWLGNKGRAAVLAVMAALMAVFFIALLCNVWVDNDVQSKKAAGNLSLEDLKAAAESDPFEWADYALSYVNSVTTMHADGTSLSDATLAQAEKFATKLAAKDSNTIPRYLAEYYFEMGREEQGFAMIEKFVSYVSANPNTWNAAFSILANYDLDHTDAYHDQVRHIAQMLEDWNAANMGTIVLDEPLQPFLEHVTQ